MEDFSFFEDHEMDQKFVETTPWVSLSLAQFSICHLICDTKRVCILYAYVNVYQLIWAIFSIFLFVITL